MNLDTQKRHLDKLGQWEMSKFFVFKFKKISPKKGNLDTKRERYIGGACTGGLHAIKNHP
jgi:hypothetical protein